MAHEVSGPFKLEVATSSRADFGHLRPFVSLLKTDPRLDLQLLVTGSHLSSRFGNTVAEVDACAIEPTHRLPLPLDDDSPQGVASAFAELVRLTALHMRDAPSDAVVLYGDRWEMLAIAVAALLSSRPMVHIGGGDVTSGAYDEAFRHSITKMSQLHFVTNEESRDRVLQMGEDPDSVFVTGSLAIDAIKQTVLMSRDDFRQRFSYEFREKNILVTFHPATLDANAEGELREFLSALSMLPDSVGILMTRPSLDTKSLHFAEYCELFVRDRPGSLMVNSLGHQGYCSALALFDAVVGNSSSGIYEAPSFNKPTVNVGDRQAGRLRASSVIDCPPQRQVILAAIMKAIDQSPCRTVNPYGSGNAAELIRDLILENRHRLESLRKEFRQLK